MKPLRICQLKLKIICIICCIVISSIGFEAVSWASTLPVYPGNRVAIRSQEDLKRLLENVMIQNQNAIFAFPLTSLEVKSLDVKQAIKEVLLKQKNDVLDMTWYISKKNELRIRSWAYKGAIRVENAAAYEAILAKYNQTILKTPMTFILYNPQQNDYKESIQFINDTHIKIENRADQSFSVQTYSVTQYIYDKGQKAFAVNTQKDLNDALKSAIDEGISAIHLTASSEEIEEKLWTEWIEAGMKQALVESPLGIGIVDTRYSWILGKGIDIIFEYGAHPLELKNKSVIDKEIKTQVAAVLKKGMSQKEIALKLHQVVAERVSYDFDTLYLKDEPLRSVYSSIWKNGQAVCGGYAALYQKMLLEAGIDCKIVIGTANDVGHAWNLVKIDGVYYHIDVTYDDRDDYVRYSYFMKSDADFKALGRTWESEYIKSAPKSYNHYKTLGLSAKDESTFLAIIKKQMKENKPIFVESSKAKTYLESENFKKMALGFFPKGYSYEATYDGDLLIMVMKSR